MLIYIRIGFIREHTSRCNTHRLDSVPIEYTESNMIVSRSSREREKGRTIGQLDSRGSWVYAREDASVPHI